MMRPYEKGDALKMELREDNRTMSPEIVDACFTCEAGYGYTFENSKGIGAVVGLITAWEGVANVAIMVNDIMIPHALSFTKSSRELLDMYAKEFKIHRYQGTIDPRVERNRGWARIVGFEEEGIMKNATPDGHDLIMICKLYPHGTQVPTGGQ